MADDVCLNQKHALRVVMVKKNILKDKSTWKPNKI